MGFADELRPGDVASRTLAGRELVLFRGPDGAPVALDAHCPHLGAHLGRGGTVVDGALRCPFHGFRFAPDGACVSGYDGHKAPPAARLRAWPARETNGLLLVWWAPDGRAPTFDVPPVDRARWTAWRRHTFQLRGHPQDVAENSVDTGHLAVVHGYRDVRAEAPLETDGPLLHAWYSFDRPRAFVGRDTLRAQIEIFQWGLGYALVEVTLPAVGLRTRQLVLSCPTEPGRLDLRLGMAVHEVDEPGRLHALLSWLPAAWFPGRWLAERIADHAISGYAADVEQDLVFWETRHHVARPALADGDGPIGRYRSWVRQFYPPG